MADGLGIEVAPDVGADMVIEGNTIEGNTIDDTPEPETPAPDAPAPTTPAAKAAKIVEEQFIDPATLPEEIKPHWKRMHSTYNKRLEEIRSGKQDIEFLAKFRSDPEFARTVLIAEGQRLGVQYAAPNGAAKPATDAAPVARAAGDAPPPALVARIKARYAREAPELEWMAERSAADAWDAIRFHEAPKEKLSQEQRHAERQEQYDDLSQKLTAAAPGWEEHETDMSELLGYLQSPALTHAKFGSKLELLHRMVRPENGQARVAAIRSMGEAARNATRTGQPGRSTVTNLPDRIRNSPNTRTAIAIASEEAERELRANGQAVPD